MLYLLDANTLIDAKNRYYPFQRVPEFWDWLLYQGELGFAKMPREIHYEITDKSTPKDQRDDLARWAETAEFVQHLLLSEEADQGLVARIVYEGYTEQPTEDDLETMGNDPFLLSYALRDIKSRTVVTNEVSAPRKTGANRKIPDVAKKFGINCIDTIRMMDNLDFRTSWSRKDWTLT